MHAIPQTRMTKQRALILDTLRSVVSHPTADEIYHMVRKKMPKISLGTVYRNLDMLAGAGEVTLLERTGGQKRFDGNTMPHQHVRCLNCGRVADVYPALPLSLPDVSAVKVPGFVLRRIDVEITGVCDGCKGYPL